MATLFDDAQFGVVLNLSSGTDESHTKTISGINSTLVDSLQSAQADLINEFGDKLAACTTDTLVSTVRTTKQEVITE